MPADLDRGTELLVVVPFPSSPLPLSPQHHTVPPVFSAHVWSPPAVTVAQSVACPLTWTGTELSVVVPFPSSPELLTPQHHTVPPVFSAHV